MGKSRKIQVENENFQILSNALYVPKFSPVDKQFGCLTSTKYAPLLYKFKVLDRDQPDTTDLDFRGKEFEALLAYRRFWGPLTLSVPSGGTDTLKPFCTTIRVLRVFKIYKAAMDSE